MRARAAKPAPPKTIAPTPKKVAARRVGRRPPGRLSRDRRILEEVQIVQAPPSSLDMDRRGSAVGTGRAETAHDQSGEELRSSDKIAERDRHRWELDPASSEDDRNRKP